MPAEKQSPTVSVQLKNIETEAFQDSTRFTKALLGCFQAKIAKTVFFLLNKNLGRKEDKFNIDPSVLNLCRQDKNAGPLAILIRLVSDEVFDVSIEDLFKVLYAAIEYKSLNLLKKLFEVESVKNGLNASEPHKTVISLLFQYKNICINSLSSANFALTNKSELNELAFTVFRYVLINKDEKFFSNVVSASADEIRQGMFRDFRLVFLHAKQEDFPPLYNLIHGLLKPFHSFQKEVITGLDVRGILWEDIKISAQSLSHRLSDAQTALQLQCVKAGRARLFGNIAKCFLVFFSAALQIIALLGVVSTVVSMSLMPASTLNTMLQMAVFSLSILAAASLVIPCGMLIISPKLITVEAKRDPDRFESVPGPLGAEIHAFISLEDEKYSHSRQLTIEEVLTFLKEIELGGSFAKIENSANQGSVLRISLMQMQPSDEKEPLLGQIGSQRRYANSSLN